MSMPDKKPLVLDSERLSELWMVIKSLLSGKVDLSTLDRYPTIDAVATAISTSLADYIKFNDANELIRNALSNYMTSSEINEAILKAIKESSTFRKEVIDKLPDIGEENVIYLVPSEEPSERDTRIEYLWIDDVGYERIGSTTANLENYWSKEELKIMTSEQLEEILNGIE